MIYLLIQIMNEIFPCKNDIHSYEIIHPRRWIKITLNFRFQAPSSDFTFIHKSSSFCLNINVYLSINFGETFFYVLSSILIVIELGSILTSKNMFVIWWIHPPPLFFAFHYISFCILIFYMKKGRLNELFWPCKCL